MLLIKKAKIVDSSSKHNGKTVDVFIEKGKIAKIGKDISNKKAKVFEAKNLHLSTGWFDMRANFREPGEEYKEGLQNGMDAAANGGFTGVLLMPSTTPAVDSKADIDYIKTKTANHAVEVFASGCITAGRQGEEISEMFDMHQAGAIAFTDDKQSITNPDLLKRALLYTKAFDALIIHYPNEQQVASNGQMHEGDISTGLGLKGIPALAEEIAISRDLYLLEYTEGKLHLAPISTEKSVEMIKAAKKKKLKLTTEVAAHNLLLGDKELEGFDSYFKTNPPLRSKQHIKALLKGLKDGTIDVISSDHSPEDEENKKREFEHAAFGISSIETAFAVANTATLGSIKLEQLIEKISTNPRAILGLPSPTIAEGETANLTFFNPKEEWKVQATDLKSKGKNSPFIGRKLTGKVLGVYSKGKLVKA